MVGFSPPVRLAALARHLDWADRGSSRAAAAGVSPTPESAGTMATMLPIPRLPSSAVMIQFLSTGRIAAVRPPAAAGANHMRANPA